MTAMLLLHLFDAGWGDAPFSKKKNAAFAGFTKNQLKVQVENSGCLRISGERALNGGRQWCHFLKRFDLPAACDAGEIKVKLDKGVLYVQVPCPSDATTTTTTARSARRTRCQKRNTTAPTGAVATPQRGETTRTRRGGWPRA